MLILKISHLTSNHQPACFHYIASLAEPQNDQIHFNFHIKMSSSLSSLSCPVPSVPSTNGAIEQARSKQLPQVQPGGKQIKFLSHSRRCSCRNIAEVGRVADHTASAVVFHQRHRLVPISLEFIFNEPISLTGFFFCEPQTQQEDEKWLHRNSRSCYSMKRIKGVVSGAGTIERSVKHQVASRWIG